MSTRQRRAPSLTTVDAVAQFSFVVQGLVQRRADEQGVSMVQIRLLGILRDRTPTMNELARLLGLDKSSVTGLVDRAEHRGLVARVASPTDRRAVHVGLSDVGRALVSTVSAQFEADVADLLRVLPPAERRQLADLLGRALAAHAAGRGIDPST